MMPNNIRQEGVCACPHSICRNRTIKLRVDGQNVDSPHCRYHACRMLENGRICLMPKLPRLETCHEHLRCSGVRNGERCRLNVRDDNPGQYRFCGQLHNCLHKNCTNERVLRNAEDGQFCVAHKCQWEGCGNERVEDGVFCTTHTCADEHCRSGVSPDIAEGGHGHGHPNGNAAQRLCERHRRCHNPNCNRFCHVRESGVMSPYCNTHCCEASECNQERRGGSYCGDHVCVIPGCAKGRTSAVDGTLCKEHKCLVKACQNQRIGASYCPWHECVQEGCEELAGQERCCEGHQRCSEPGCAKRRFKFNGRSHDRCEDHYYGICQGVDLAPGCGNRVCHGTSYCQDHLCQARGCREPKMFPFLHCATHKCSVPECHETRKSFLANVPLAAATRFGGSAFCQRHACDHRGCQGRAEESEEDGGLGSRYCAEHRRCRVVGCGRRVDRGADDSSLCREHDVQEREARGERERLRRQQQQQQRQQEEQQYQQQQQPQPAQAHFYQPHPQPYFVRPQPQMQPPVSGIFVVPQPPAATWAPAMMRPHQIDGFYSL